MQHINRFLQSNIKKQAFENIVLLAVLDVDWNNLQVDTLVAASDSFINFISNKADYQHFKRVDKMNSRFVTFYSGRSSATSINSDGTAQLSTYFFCLPAKIYNELMEQYNANTTA